MNDVPRLKLAEIVAQRGPALGDDPRCCEGLLRDLCGEHRREIHALVSAAKERVPADLLSSQTRKSPEIQLARLTQRLQDNLALSEEASRWAVETWALALGVISAAQLPPVLKISAGSPAAQDQQPQEAATKHRRQADQRPPQVAHRERAAPQEPTIPPPPTQRPDKTVRRRSRVRPALLILLGLELGIWAYVNLGKYWPAESPPARPTPIEEPAHSGLPPSSSSEDARATKPVDRSEPREHADIDKPSTPAPAGGTVEPSESPEPVAPAVPMPGPSAASAPPG
jgi:hypothetical protein